MPRKAKSFDDMDTKVLICRVGRHQLPLEMSEIVVIGRREGLKYHWGPCANCKTWRYDTVLANHRQHSVEMVSRVYEHPDGYLIEKIDEWGGRVVFNQNVRYEMFVRNFEAVKGGKKRA